MAYNIVQEELLANNEKTLRNLKIKLTFFRLVNFFMGQGQSGLHLEEIIQSFRSNESVIYKKDDATLTHVNFNCLNSYEINQIFIFKI